MSARSVTPKALIEQLGLDPADQALRLRWLNLTEDDLARVRTAATYLRPETDTIVRRFYDHSWEFPAFTGKVDESGSRRELLEQAQKGYFLGLLDARIDNTYWEGRLRVGARHAELNVEPRWNVGNYALYAELVLPYLAKHCKPNELIPTILAFFKLFILDASLAVETYISEGVLQRLVDVNETLTASAGSLDTNTSQVETAAKEIADAIQQIAEGATDQTTAMTQTTAEMQALSQAAADVKQGAEEQFNGVQSAAAAMTAVSEALTNVAETAGTATAKGSESLEAATAGVAAVEQTVEAMTTIRTAVLETSVKIEELGNRGAEIGAIIQTIDDIASQTNLLALNAAIEAARAGEQGRGFAVVADEVRKLAERTAVATKEIADLIAAVQQNTEQAVHSMATSVQDVETGTARAEEAGAALSRIVESATEVSGEVDQIAQQAATMQQSVATLDDIVRQVGEIADRSTRVSEEMSASATRATEAINSASAVAQESAASTQEVSASVEEVTAQMGEVASQARALGDVAGDMAQFLARFGQLAHNSRGEQFRLAA